jgi:hypothetical protein
VRLLLKSRSVIGKINFSVRRHIFPDVHLIFPDVHLNFPCSIAQGICLQAIDFAR